MMVKFANIGDLIIVNGNDVPRVIIGFDVSCGQDCKAAFSGCPGRIICFPSFRTSVPGAIGKCMYNTYAQALFKTIAIGSIGGGHGQ